MSTATTSVWHEHPVVIETDPWPQDPFFDVVVVGGGLTGLATGVLLARSRRRVAVTEARRVGAVTTGNTTAKITLLQGTRLSTVAKAHSERVAAAYLEGSRAGQQWLLKYCDEHDVAYQRRDAVTYTINREEAGSVIAEMELGQRLGLNLVDDAGAELPFPIAAGTRLSDQAQFDPMPALAALTAELRTCGGVVVEDARVTDVASGKRSTLTTRHGELSADDVVLASGVPILDRGMYFAKVTAQRSYVTAFAVDGPIPEQMYLSIDTPSRSLRTVNHRGRELLLVGGNGHTVGQHRRPPSELVADLVGWTRTWFPRAEHTHTWSAQDYQSHNHTPFVGKMPRGGGHVWVATGYGKWGMTGAPMAALHLTGEILGNEPEWAATLSGRISRPSAAVEALTANAKAGAAAVEGWAATARRPLDDASRTPAEGEGRVGAVHGQPIAVSTRNGSTCELSAVCTHLGGVVRFNDLERTWDCPLHGSRFAVDGAVLEGPATEPLARHATPDITARAPDPDNRPSA